MKVAVAFLGSTLIHFNPIALRIAKTPKSFGCSECNRVKPTSGEPEFRGERCRTCPPLHSHPHKKVMIISGQRNKCGNFTESTWIFSFVA